MRFSKTAARVGVAAIVCLALALAAMHAVQPGLDPTRHYVSEYAYGTIGIWLQIGYIVAGAGALLIAWSVATWLAGSRWAAVAAASLALVAAGLAATGLTRIDVPGGDVVTTSGTLHELAGYVAILGLLVGGFSLAAALGRTRRARLATVARRYAWIVVLAIVATIVLQRLDLAGLGQRIFLAGALSWLMWVGVRAARWDARRERGAHAQV